MAAEPARERSSSAGYLSIGQVLARLSPEFPGLSASKLRFLESQGIVTPVRTESSYRKYSPADLERVRLALTLQRDHFMPHSVIRDFLNERDAGGDAGVPTAAPPSIVATGRRYRRDELLHTSGATAKLLDDAVSAGLVPAAESYADQSVATLRALVALDRHGIEPRHLRSMRQSAERDVALIASALAPLLRRTDGASRTRGAELAPELAKRLDEVRAVFVRTALEKLLD
ncbi:MerR family transcriptional regulator [Microbacterium fluvii]|uniref:MerR family transcriptional regulator n=1 Tax=Microbacterium fluvii TaxID=415215 RepID=A0ABW2HJZ1_9MICO|nr:MerR family transcriptional regulator [Microbacterium fluvii]MCU4673617.1 MerR family transcriptional regulator [Microbacterium fluvii]